MFQYVVALLVVLIAWGLLKYLKWYSEIYYHIEKIEGPKAYPFIGNLYLFFGVKRSDMFKLLVDITNKYGTLFRSYNGSQHEINIAKPEHFEVIMSSSVHIKKGTTYQMVKQWLGDGLLIIDGAKWHQRRKLITPTFHFKILENFMNVFVEKSKLLVDYLKEQANGKSFDIYSYITHCTLDVICETAMGVSINTIADRNHSYTRAVFKTSELFIRRQFSLIQQTPLYPFTKNGKAFYKNLKLLHSFTDKVISDRRKYLKENPNKIEKSVLGEKRRLSFLDLLLETSLKDTDIRAEVDTFMFGGHDTTTAAICWSLFLFSLNQDIQEKVYQEIKSVIGDKKSPETISELNELKYLECCFKEALRLYPSVPLIGRNLTEEITLDGYKIPKGTNININIYHVHRDPNIYPHPDKFDPDRFLPENCKNRHPYAYVPFSAGPRSCIGQKFAMYQGKTLLASILNNFKVFPVDNLETITPVAELVLRPQGGLNIVLEKRVK